MAVQNAFDHLRKKAATMLAKNPGITQVIAVQTASGNVYGILNDQVTAGNYQAEEALFADLVNSGDTHILYAVALWSNGQPDLPSFHFRSHLAALNSHNLDTLLLLQGRDGYHCRSLRTTL